MGDSEPDHPNEPEKKDIILHVAVVGFHHKKGKILEFSYPPLLDGEPHNSSALPTEWRSLPALALPDGAHHHEKDCSYFLLPHPDSEKCVFGVSCYRQIETKKLKVKDADVCRDTVQKSVVIISTVPLFGVLKAKLEMVSEAFFKERDFTKVTILQELHQQVNMAVTGWTPEMCLADLSARKLVQSFRHRTLLLFKLLLLEKRNIFFGVADGLGQIILSLVSLFPKMVEEGLYHACADGPMPETDDNSNHPTPRRSSEPDMEIHNDEVFTLSKRSTSEQIRSPILEHIAGGLTKLGRRGSILLKDLIEVEMVDLDDVDNFDSSGLEDPGLHEVAGFGSLVLDLPSPPREDPNPESIPDSPLEIDEFGFPLAIFTGNYLLMPYCCLQQHSLLQNVTFHSGFTAASSNVLFRAQKHLSDVLIEIDAPYEIDYRDPKLERLCQLTQADLRFVDNMLSVIDENDGNTTWEGSDSWIRSQFRQYLVGLLSASMTSDTKRKDDYGRYFVDSFTRTRCHKIWRFSSKPAFHDHMCEHPAHVPAANPFSELKLRLTSTLQGSERGRMMEEAITSGVDRAGSWLTTLRSKTISETLQTTLDTLSIHKN